MAEPELFCGPRATDSGHESVSAVGSVIDVCSKLIAMRSAKHAQKPVPAGVCAVHGTPMHALSAVSSPRADCFSGQRSAAPFYLALRFFRVFVHLNRVIRLGAYQGSRSFWTVAEGRGIRSTVVLECAQTEHTLRHLDRRDNRQLIDMSLITRAAPERSPR